MWLGSWHGEMATGYCTRGESVRRWMLFTVNNSQLDSADVASRFDASWNVHHHPFPHDSYGAAHYATMRERNSHRAMAPVRGRDHGLCERWVDPRAHW